MTSGLRVAFRSSIELSTLLQVVNWRAQVLTGCCGCGCGGLTSHIVWFEARKAGWGRAKQGRLQSNDRLRLWLRLRLRLWLWLQLWLWDAQPAWH